MTKIYSNVNSDTKLTVKEYWGGLCCVDIVANKQTHKLTTTVKYEFQTDVFDENGFASQNREFYEEPEKVNGIYVIKNAGNLYWFSDYVNNEDGTADAVLANDITVNENVVSGNLLNEGLASTFKTWTPIGLSNTKKFKGTFDGRGYSIKGLYYNATINNTSENYKGLFGYLDNATISNVNVAQSYFKGYQYVGGIAGYMNNSSKIINCGNTSIVSVINNYCGGIVGYNYRCEISNCTNSGYIYGQGGNIGSIAGYTFGTTAYGTKVANCYWLQANNQTLDRVGAVQNKSTITDCSSFTVNYETEKGTLTTPINGNTDLIELLNDYAIEEGYQPWGLMTNTNDLVYVMEEVGKYDENGFSDDGGYEPPIWNHVEGYYEIRNAGNLYWFANKVNTDYSSNSWNAILINDITINDTIDLDNPEKNRSWTPIGKLSKNYIGNFEGNGKTISGIYFNNPKAEYVGLFGIVQSPSVIENLTLDNIYICGIDYIGGIAGKAGIYNDAPDVNVSITNCEVHGTITCDGILGSAGGLVGISYPTIFTDCTNYVNINGTSDKHGGIVGLAQERTVIINCRNEGKISGNGEIGGICGYAGNNILIDGCINNNEISASNGYAGGIAGYCREEVTIRNTINTSPIVGDNYVGGIAGFLIHKKGTDNYINISNSSNSGQITIKYELNYEDEFYENAYAGGIVGILDSYAKTENCTNAASVNGQQDWHLGSIAGYLYESSISNCYYVNDDIPSIGGQHRGTAEQNILRFVINDDRENATLSAAVNGKTDLVEVLNEYASSDNIFKEWELMDSNSGIMFVARDSSELFPIKINTEADFAVFVQDVNNGETFKNKFIDLNCNITTPLTSVIGKDEEKDVFSGNFNGNGNYIAVEIDNTDDQNAVASGLFGIVSNATIRNLTVIGSVRGIIYVGGIAGWAINSTIENCSNICDLHNGLSVGGILGNTESSKISYCTNAGFLHPGIGNARTDYMPGFAAGICASSIDSKFDHCYSYSDCSTDIVNIIGEKTKIDGSCSSFSMVNNKPISDSNNDDILTILNRHADTSSKYKPWKLFIKEGSDMFVFDYINLKISQYGWSSCCLPFNSRSVSESGIAYYAKADECKEKIDLTMARIIPAYEGVFVRGENGKKVIFKYTTSTADKGFSNDVIGTVEEGGKLITDEENAIVKSKYYILSQKNGVFGLYWEPTAQSQGNSAFCQQYKALLKVEMPQAAEIKQFYSLDDSFSDYMTEISSSYIENENNMVNDGYMMNVAGQIVGKGYNGIVIKNGKKFFKR